MASSFYQQKKPATSFAAGFTICSLTPLVTTLGCQFIASTTLEIAAYKLEHEACQRGSGKDQAHVSRPPQYSNGQTILEHANEGPKGTDWRGPGVSSNGGLNCGWSKVRIKAGRSCPDNRVLELRLVRT